eukprot:6200144-Pleurochrysis_carterae.AAC.6
MAGMCAPNTRVPCPKRRSRIRRVRTKRSCFTVGLGVASIVQMTKHGAFALFSCRTRHGE